MDKIIYMLSLALIALVFTIFAVFGSVSAEKLTQPYPYCSPQTQTWCMKSCLKYRTARRLKKCAIRCIKLNGCYKITLVGRNG